MFCIVFETIYLDLENEFSYDFYHNTFFSINASLLYTGTYRVRLLKILDVTFRKVFQITLPHIASSIERLHTQSIFCNVPPNDTSRHHIVV